MSFAHVNEIVEVSDVIQANQLIKEGHELLQIVPGWTSDNTPCTLFYLAKPKVGSQSHRGDWEKML